MIKSLLAKLVANILRVLILISCKLITGIQAFWIKSANEKATIYYANHSSHLDGLVIWSCLPKALRPKVHPVAARDYWTSSPFKQFIAERVFNAVLINRNPKKEQENPLTPLKTLLEHHHSLLIFPEGTRGAGDCIHDFKGGIYHLAKQFPDVEFVPVYLNNLNRVLPKGSKLVVPIICTATFGMPISPLDEGESKEAFLIRAKQSLEELAP